MLTPAWSRLGVRFLPLVEAARSCAQVRMAEPGLVCSWHVYLCPDPFWQKLFIISSSLENSPTSGILVSSVPVFYGPFKANSEVAFVSSLVFSAGLTGTPVCWLLHMWFIRNKLGQLVQTIPVFANSRIIIATWDEMSESIKALICTEWVRYFSRGERDGVYIPDMDLGLTNC